MLFDLVLRRIQAYREWLEGDAQRIPDFVDSYAGYAADKMQGDVKIVRCVAPAIQRPSPPGDRLFDGRCRAPVWPECDKDAVHEGVFAEFANYSILFPGGKQAGPSVCAPWHLLDL